MAENLRSPNSSNILCTFRWQWRALLPVQQDRGHLGMELIHLKCVERLLVELPVQQDKITDTWARSSYNLKSVKCLLLEAQLGLQALSEQESPSFKSSGSLSKRLYGRTSKEDQPVYGNTHLGSLNASDYPTSSLEDCPGALVSVLLGDGVDGGLGPQQSAPVWAKT